MMNICLPYITLEPVMDKLNTKFWYSNLQEKNDETYEDTIEHLISRANIPIRVVLGKSTLSVDDFVSLQTGDIIRLSTKVDDELPVYVGNIHKFMALPGSSGNNYAVKITDILKEDDDE